MISDFSKDDRRCFHFLPFLSRGGIFGDVVVLAGTLDGPSMVLSSSPSHTTAMILGTAQDFDLA